MPNKRNIDVKLRAINKNNLQDTLKTPTNELLIKNVKGYYEKIATKFGNGAKVDIPKEHLGKKVILIVVNH